MTSVQLHLLRPQVNHLPWRTSTRVVSAHTGMKKSFQILEDDLSFWPFLLSLVPALLSNIPDSWRHSRCLKEVRLRWPLPLQDYGGDVTIPFTIREWRLPGHKLGEELSETGYTTFPQSIYTSTITIDKE